MVKKLVAIAILAGIAFMLYGLFASYTQKETLPKTSRYYAIKGPDELGSANLVTSVVVTYRGLDTLGEVTILFTVASIIGFFLRSRTKREARAENPRETSEILHTGVAFLVPIIFVFGAYVFIGGHLSPGGGFQGGAIIASGTLLLFLAQPKTSGGHTLITFVESVSGIAYVGIGIAGIFLANGFLDNRILPVGEFGTIFSAGAIPIIYSLIGLKVGAELSAILYKLKDAKEDA
ncbi:sodium:proton antiporter [Myxococcota bacterium]|nr:sodium:proton antiporter [Myxococcota bacterium]MBU1535994.1 sodium:proton antiporter [Myxococcota bacterium]